MKIILLVVRKFGDVLPTIYIKQNMRVGIVRAVSDMLRRKSMTRMMVFALIIRNLIRN